MLITGYASPRFADKADETRMTCSSPKRSSTVVLTNVLVDHSTYVPFSRSLFPSNGTDNDDARPLSPLV